jgi:hypothetical protein
MSIYAVFTLGYLKLERKLNHFAGRAKIFKLSDAARERRESTALTANPAQRKPVQPSHQPSHPRMRANEHESVEPKIAAKLNGIIQRGPIDARF